MGIDWGIQYFKLHMSNNYRRLVTGILCGFGVTYVYLFLIYGCINVFYYAFPFL